MKTLWRVHGAGIILALVAGLIAVTPNLIFINSDNYAGLPFTSTDAETWYLSRINGVYKGCFLSCNPYIKEYGDNFPFFDSSLSETILALPGIVTNTPVVSLKVFYEFFLICLLCFLAYLLIFRLTGNNWLSVFGAVFIVLGHNLLNSTDLVNIPDLVDLIGMKTDNTQFLIFSRPVNPQFSSVYFFIYLHILLSAAVKKNWKWFGLLALVYGFSFYIYFFTYAFATVIQFIWIGICVVGKKLKMFGMFTISALTGLIIAIPQFIQFFRLFAHPYYSTIPTEYLILSHIPDVSIVGSILFILFILAIIFYVNKYTSVSSEAYFVGVLVLACFVTRNEHILSGMIMQYDHFQTYLFDPIFVIIICFCLQSFVKQAVMTRYKWIIIFLCLIPIYNSSLIQYSSYKHWLPYTISSQKYVPVLRWLRDKALPEDAVVSAPMLISGFIPVYTRHYVLWSDYAAQWMSIPGRIQDAIDSRTSAEKLEQTGHRYKVEYFVEEKKSGNFFQHLKSKEKVFEDENFVVYKSD